MFTHILDLIHKYGTASAVDFDATGKLGPSLVEGNRVWLGDYEACQSLNESLYCVADLSVNLSPPLQANFVRIIAENFCSSTLKMLMLMVTTKPKRVSPVNSQLQDLRLIAQSYWMTPLLI